MAKNKKQENFIYRIVVLLSALFIIIGANIFKVTPLEELGEEFYQAQVVAVGETETEVLTLDENTTQENKIIHFSAKIKNGTYKNQIVKAIQHIDAYVAIQPKEIQKGDQIILSPGSFYEGEEQEEFIFVEQDRSESLLWLCGIFLLLILLVGKRKGFSAILSLIFTVLTIFLVYIPSILNGFSIYTSTIMVSLFLILMNLIILNGANRKTACAVVGNIGGLLISGLIAVVMSGILGITGVVDEDYVFLMSANLSHPINLIALVWGGTVIGSLGAVMDVAMSIASSMNELSENMERPSFQKLLKSGMNIGRDAIGTMTNTLILAYVGSSLATVLLLMYYSKDPLYLFNLEMIVVEVLQAIVGSMGILFAVPATALYSATLFTKNKKNHK